MNESIDAKAAADALIEEIGAWPGVRTAEHRFGGVEFLVGRRELGHVHAPANAAGFADLPFPRPVRDELIAAGRARRHHVLPDSGWITVPIRTVADLHSVIEIFRLNYERPWSSSNATSRFGAINR